MLKLLDSFVIGNRFLLLYSSQDIFHFLSTQEVLQDVFSMKLQINMLSRASCALSDTDPVVLLLMRIFYAIHAIL